jgi:hypothetical protein
LESPPIRQEAASIDPHGARPGVYVFGVVILATTINVVASLLAK